MTRLSVVFIGALLSVTLPKVTLAEDCLAVLQARLDEMRDADQWNRQALQTKLPAQIQQTKPIPQAEYLRCCFELQDLAAPGYAETTPDGTLIKPPAAETQTEVFVLDVFNGLLGQPRNTATRDEEGKTALMYAAECNHFDTLRELLPFLPDAGFQSLYSDTDHQGRSYIDWCDHYGYTALMHASATNSVEAVNYLLNAGADVHHRCGVAQFTALQLAQNYGHRETISALERHIASKTAWEKFADDPLYATVLASLVVFLLTAVLAISQRWRRRYQKKRAETEGFRDAPTHRH